MLPPPTYGLDQAFFMIKKMQEDNGQIEQNANQNDDAEKGLKFITQTLKKILEQSPKIQHQLVFINVIKILKLPQSKQKNLKRRVYDSLNVLAAANIIIKENNLIEMVPHQPTVFSLKHQVLRKKKQIGKLKKKIEETKNQKPVISNPIFIKVSREGIGIRVVKQDNRIHIFLKESISVHNINQMVHMI